MPTPVLDIRSRQNQVSALGWGQHIDEALRAMVLCETVGNVPVWAQAGGERITVNPASPPRRVKSRRWSPAAWARLPT